MLNVTVTESTPERIAKLAAYYATRKLSDLRNLAKIMGLDDTGPRREIAARIAAKSADITGDPLKRAVSGFYVNQN